MRGSGTASHIDPNILRVNVASMGPVQPPVKRRYDASRRRQAAARTRTAILDAALQLFARQGYTATPMTAIAEQAGGARHRRRLSRPQAQTGPAPHRAPEHRQQPG